MSVGPSTSARKGHWPGAAQFNEAVQNLASTMSDAELRSGEPELSPLGVPMPYAGNFADVYKVHCPQTGNTWAVKFFKREVRDLRERYRLISQHLAAARLPFMTEFEYLEEGVRIGGAWYPLVKMRWIEGLILSRYVAQSLDQPKRLDQLFALWIQLADRLRRAGIAHADLQHGNVVLVPYGDHGRLLLKLIDYDGMFVPALAGHGSGELGRANYQHPQRPKTQAFHAELDRFSHLAICCALRSLSVGGLPLWERFNNGENLLFTAQDFAEPARSKLFRELWDLREPQVHSLVGHLLLATQRRLDETPLLKELVDQGEVRPLTPFEQQQAEAVLHGRPLPQAPRQAAPAPPQQQLVACPRCSGQVALPPNASYNMPVACPLCGQSYFLSEAVLVPMQQPILQPLPAPFPPQLPPDPFANAPPAWPTLAKPAPARGTPLRTVVLVAMILLAAAVGGWLLWAGGSRLVAWISAPPIPTNPADAVREVNETVPQFMAAIARQDEPTAAKHLARLEQLHGHPVQLPIEQWRRELESLRARLVTRRPNPSPVPPAVQGQPLTRPVDLLAVLAVPQGSVSPLRRMGGNNVVITQQLGLNRAVIPYDLPADYELEIRVTPRRGDGLLIGFPVAGRSCMVTVDGFANEPPDGKMRTAFDAIDGKRPHNPGYPEKPYYGQLLKKRFESVLSIRISGSEMTFLCDGKQVLHWNGDPKRLSLFGIFDHRQQGRVFLGTWDAEYELNSVTLKPLSGSSSGSGSLLPASSPMSVPFPKLPTGAGPIDSDAPRTFTTTASGLKYRMLRKGAGKSPTVNDMVRIHATGWFDDGRIIAGSSTYERNSPRIQRVNAPANAQGLTEALYLVREGGMIELEITPEIYGNRPPPGASPGAIVHFVIELLEIKN